MSDSGRVVFVAMVGVLVSLSACGDEIEVMVRGLTTADESCKFPVQTADEALLPAGILDISFPGVRYVSGVQVRNMGGDPLAPRRARLRLRAPDEESTSAAFGEYQWSVEIAGNLVLEDSKTTGGLGVVTAEIIPADVVANQIALDSHTPVIVNDPNARTVLDITIEFETPGGDLVESSQFSFPLEICYGCLNGYPGQNVGAGCDSGVGPGPCAATGNLCSPGQDSITKCTCE